MNSETWLPVVGYENYEVSNLGRVRSLASGRVLRPYKERDGYLRVKLSKNRKTKMHRVHRLVAMAFIPNPLGLPIINHKNERKDQNFVENLEYCDYRYNNTYGSLADKIAEKSREVYQFTMSGEFVAWYPSTAEAERQTGILRGDISQCASGKCKTQGGYQWRYEPTLFLDATNGVFNNAKSKCVYQYSLDGRFVKEWVSTHEVRRQTGWDNSAISACCLGKFYQRYGFRWFYTYQGLTLDKQPKEQKHEKLF